MIKCPSCGASHEFLRFEATVILDFHISEDGWITNVHDVVEADELVSEAICDNKPSLFCTKCGAMTEVTVDEDEKVVIK